MFACHQKCCVEDHIASGKVKLELERKIDGTRLE